MQDPITPSTRILTPIYCGSCKWPPEYCEFGSSIADCKAWLKSTHPDLYSLIYADSLNQVEALVDALNLDNTTGTIDGAQPESSNPDNSQQPVSTKLQKKKAQAAKKSIVITTIERTKKKRVTLVVGLEKFDVDLKKAAKLFATRFACGSSVTRNPQGHDEIVIQGEFADDVFELVTATWPAITEDVIEFGETKSKK